MLTFLNATQWTSPPWAPPPPRAQPRAWPSSPLNGSVGGNVLD